MEMNKLQYEIPALRIIEIRCRQIIAQSPQLNNYEGENWGQIN